MQPIADFRDSEHAQVVVQAFADICVCADAQSYVQVSTAGKAAAEEAAAEGGNFLSGLFGKASKAIEDAQKAAQASLQDAPEAVESAAKDAQKAVESTAKEAKQATEASATSAAPPAAPKPKAAAKPAAPKAAPKKADNGAGAEDPVAGKRAAAVAAALKNLGAAPKEGSVADEQKEAAPAKAATQVAEKPAPKVCT